LQIVVGLPRSTWIHCGSLNALDHRVPTLPSKAAAADSPASWTEEARGGLFNATLVAPHVPPDIVPNTWNSHSE
jgi:hypothetical protein